VRKVAQGPKVVILEGKGVGCWGKVWSLTLLLLCTW